MHYLIDGYNLLFQVFPNTKDLIKKQHTLQKKIKDLLAPFPANATVVLDSFEDFGNSHPSVTHIGDLEIIYSPSSLTADEYILEYLQTHNPKNEVVVTSDNDLAYQAKKLGASILTIDAFLQKMQKKKKQDRIHEEKWEVDTEENIERLLKIFQRRFKED